MEIKISNKGENGSAIATENGQEVGVVNYAIIDDNTISINHTEVIPALEGQGLGKKMLMEVVKMSRKKDIKIIPRCSFALAMFEKNPDIQDVVKSS